MGHGVWKLDSVCVCIFLNTALQRGEVTGKSATRTHTDIYILYTGSSNANQQFVYVNILDLRSCLGSLLMCVSTCEVEASEREEVLDVVMSQFHHDQADQSPAAERQYRKNKV